MGSPLAPLERGEGAAQRRVRGVDDKALFCKTPHPPSGDLLPIHGAKGLNAHTTHLFILMERRSSHIHPAQGQIDPAAAGEVIFRQ